MEEKTREQPQTQAQEPAREPESHPVKHTPKSSKKILLLIAVLVLLIVIAAASTVFNFLGKAQNTTSNTSNPAPTPTLTQEATWKTYTNTKYNYTINYPGDWSVREYSDSKEGAAFNPLNQPGYPDTSDAISISAGPKISNYQDYSLEQYAKIAATAEIQNYNSLASFKKVTTADGAVGYKTTWMVQSISVMGRPPADGESESLPITYFEIPGNKTSLVRVTLNRKEDLAAYEKMLLTVKAMTTLTPIPTVDETAVLKYVIKKYIALKHNSKENSLTITVSKIEGNYAQGGASDEGGGGGMWFAAKEDGAWRLVWDGNGVIECSTLTLYPNFPTSMIPECYDTAKQDIIKR
jgi:hypothetical protein